MEIEGIAFHIIWEHERTKQQRMSTTSIDHLSKGKGIKSRNSCMARIRNGLVVPSHENKNVFLAMSILSQSQMNTNMG